MSRPTDALRTIRAGPPGRVSPARRCAYAVVRRVFEAGAYADRALHAEAVGLDSRERALATRLAYGTVQRRLTLDHVIEGLAERPVRRLDGPVLAALRLGSYELLFSAAAPHAAVHESVELAKRSGPRGARLVNAVLRRAGREGPALLGALDDRTPESAALRHSVPVWIVRLWWDTFGPGPTRALLQRVNEPAEAALRANLLVGSADELRARLPVASHRTPQLPEALVLEAPFDAHGHPLWRAGAYMPQSRASMLVARAVAPEPDERILDLCAAPGAKTTHLAALMSDRGTLIAVERHAGRARALRASCERMCARSVFVEVRDAGVAGTESFDRVLVDPPCSGLGTLQARPDLRWRASPERLSALAAEQRRVLAAAAGAVRAGGLLVYSTCTLSPEENEHQIARFLDAHPDFTAAPVGPDLEPYADPLRPGELLVLPHRHGTDGFFIARLRRRGSSGSGRARADRRTGVGARGAAGEAAGEAPAVNG